MKIFLRYWWLWITLLSFITYFPVLNNFFAFDDFIWLYRAKTLQTNPAQIFQIEGLYFDPVVYLSFWLDFNLFDLNPTWYHLTDIALHTTNGLLLFTLVKLYSKDELSALFSSLIFVSTFGASDAVIWPSARVDLIAATFSLIAVTLFLSYLREGKVFMYACSVIAFVLALGAKGTPVVLPVLLFWIFVKERPDTRKRYIVLAPFVFTAAGYLTLLHIASVGGSPLSKGIFHPNFYNYSLAIASFYIPEPLLSKLNLTYIFPLLYALLFLIVLIRFPVPSNRVKSLGLFTALLFLIPVLILGDALLATPDYPKYLFASLSHRIYLASVGMSMFVGSIIVWLTHIVSRKRTFWAKTVAPVVLAMILGLNIYETRQREKIWDALVTDIKDTVYGLKRSKLHIPDGSVIIGISFPMSGGFIEPMLKLYYDLKEVTYFHIKELPEELPEHQLSFGREYTLFFKKWNILLIRGSDTNIYDLRHQFYELSEIAINYRNTSDIEQQARYYQEYKAMAAGLNQYIRLL